MSAPIATLPTLANELQALLQSAAAAPLSRRGWLRVTGEDRVRWLNGMVTNSIQSMAVGEGSYSFVLNAQGRIQGDLTAWMLEDAILLETEASQIAALTTLLDHYIIMDDVELADISGERQGLLLAGPQASALLEKIGVAAESSATPLRLETVRWMTHTFTLVHAHSPLVPRFELWAEAATIAAISEALAAAGAAAVGDQALEQLRLLEGTPLYGVDIRDKELPQETGQARALHFNKGCYLGQEIVERIRSRGNVHRTFTGFVLTGSLPAAGTALEAAGKPVGEITSVATIPLPGEPLPVQLALGYIRREALERHELLAYAEDTDCAGGIAAPIVLPYKIADL